MDRTHARDPTGLSGLMLVGNVAGKVAVLIDDLADVPFLLEFSHVVDCTDARLGSPAAPSIWCNKSLRSSYAWHSFFLGNNAHQLVLHR